MLPSNHIQSMDFLALERHFGQFFGTPGIGISFSVLGTFVEARPSCHCATGKP